MVCCIEVGHVEMSEGSGIGHIGGLLSLPIAQSNVSRVTECRILDDCGMSNVEYQKGLLPILCSSPTNMTHHMNRHLEQVGPDI